MTQPDREIHIPLENGPIASLLNTIASAFSEVIAELPEDQRILPRIERVLVDGTPEIDFSWERGEVERGINVWLSGEPQSPTIHFTDLARAITSEGDTRHTGPTTIAQAPLCQVPIDVLKNHLRQAYNHVCPLQSEPKTTSPWR